LRFKFGYAIAKVCEFLFLLHDKYHDDDVDFNNLTDSCVSFMRQLELQFYGGAPWPPAQGTPSPVSPLAYGIQICVRAYGASAFAITFKFFYIKKYFCRRPSHIP